MKNKVLQRTNWCKNTRYQSKEEMYWKNKLRNYISYNVHNMINWSLIWLGNSTIIKCLQPVTKWTGTSARKSSCTTKGMLGQDRWWKGFQVRLELFEKRGKKMIFLNQGPAQAWEKKQMQQGTAIPCQLV